MNNWRHVVPVDDIKEHKIIKDCHCIPHIDWENEVVIHSAFDGRDSVEQAKYIVKEKGNDKRIIG